MIALFADQLQSLVIEHQATGSRVRGEWVPGSAPEPTRTHGIAQPLSPERLRSMPEGAYRTGDQKIWLPADVPVKSEDTIVLEDGRRFQVRDISDREFEGEFLTCYAKQSVERDDDD